MVRKVHGAMGMPTESTTQRAATGSPNSQPTARMRISAGAMDGLSWKRNRRRLRWLDSNFVLVQLHRHPLLQ